MDSQRWFRRLLKLLPADFQADYARDMEQTFRAQQREAARGGVRRLAALWWETLRDLLRTAPREHFDQLAQDARYAARTMRRRPGFAGAAVATLAVGIGSVSAILSVVHGVDWRPVAYPDPDRVVFLKEVVRGEPSRTTGYATFADWRARSRSFDEMAAIGSMGTTIAGTADAEQISVMRVTPGYFRVSGLEPMLGRAFGDAEDRWENRRFAVLSERLWRRRFAADAAVVGREVQLGGHQYVVTGIMREVSGDVLAEQVYGNAEVWVPLAYDVSLPFACRTCRHLRVVGRLRANVSAAEAEAEVDAITRQLGREHAATYAVPGARVERVADAVLGPIRPALYLLLAAVCLLLAMATINVANLLLVRSIARAGEIATRRALGVATGRLVRQLLTESLILAAFGAAAGLAIAYVTVRALVAIAPVSVPRMSDVALDGPVVGMTSLVALVTGLCFGLLPMWHLASADVVETLRGGRAIGPGGGRLGRLLVAGNVALAVVLLVVTGLLARSFVGLARVDPGLDPSNVTVASISLTGPAYAELPPTHVFYKRLLDALSRPGDVVALTSQLPFEQNDRAGFHVDGQLTANPEEAPSADRFAVTAGYFRALGIPLLRGRSFTDRDDAAGPPVAIINAATARQVFGDTDPIGQRIMLGPADAPRREIVGIAGDIRHEGLGAPVSIQAYLPLEQFYGSPVRVVLRARDQPAAAAMRIRAAVAELDRSQAVYDIRPLTAMIEATLAERRFLLWLIGGFAVAALLLAVIGLYGVVSYVVAQRTRDIGMRVALGADAGAVRRFVLGIGMMPVALGLAAGLALTAVATRPVEAMLFSVTRLDPITIAGAAALVAACGLLACVVPARRAARVHPVTALRAD